MCLIVHKPVGKTLPLDFLENVRVLNRDGYGWAYVCGGHLHHGKTLSWEQAVRVFRALPAQQEAYVHFRHGTSGDVSLDTAHPFVLAHDLVLMHNGMLKLTAEDSSRSDTWELARRLRDMLSGLNAAQRHALVRSQAFTWMLEQAVLPHTAVLLDTRGAVRLGRPWEVLTQQHWPGMQGVAVSNLTAWTPRNLATA